MGFESLQWEHRPTMRRPVLVAAFEGWNDAGDSATTALRHLVDRWHAVPFAEIDPEEFFDFTSTRPQVRLVDGVTRRIDWPSNRFLAGKVPALGTDAVLLLGSEPQLRWKTFCAHVVEVARVLDVELVITLGALLADVPHSRPVRITGSAADGDLVQRLKLERSQYEGPTGIVGVVHDALSAAGIPSASLWAAIPHYLPGTPSPKGALAIIERVASLLGVPIATLDLQIASTQYERQVNEVVDGDEDMSRYVRQLEEAYSEEDSDDDDADDDVGALVADLPSADALAAEVEQYLRDQNS